MKTINIKGLEHLKISANGKKIKNSKNGKVYNHFYYRDETSSWNPDLNKKRAYINLWNCQEKKLKLWPVARLVYAAYNGPLIPGQVIDHIDNNQSNDHYSNLQQISNLENTRKRRLDNDNYFKFKALQKEKEKNNKKAEYLKKHIIYCLETKQKFANMVEAAKAFNMTKAGIWAALKRNTMIHKKYHICKLFEKI